MRVRAADEVYGSFAALVAEVDRAKRVLDPDNRHQGIEDAARNVAQVIVAQAASIRRLELQLKQTQKLDRFR